MVVRKLCFLMLKCTDVHPNGEKYHFRKDTREFNIPHVVLEKNNKIKKLSKKDCEQYLDSVEGEFGCNFIAENMTKEEELRWNSIYGKYGDKRHFEKISIPCEARINTLKARGVDISRCF